MKKTLFQRVTAILLALVFVLSGALAVSASDFLLTTSSGLGNSSGLQSVTDKTIADYADKLAAVSYEEYRQKNADVKRATQKVTTPATEYDPETTTAEVETVTIDGVEALYIPTKGSVSYKVTVPETAKYSIVFHYNAVVGKAAAVERQFTINGKTPFSEAFSFSLPKNYVSDYAQGRVALSEADLQKNLARANELGLSATSENVDGKSYIVIDFPDHWTGEIADFLNKELGVRFMTVDISRNELRPAAVQSPTWKEYTLRDISGYYSENFEFVLEAGENVITLIGVNEPVALSAIDLVPYEAPISYAEYRAKYQGKPQGGDIVKIEGEYNSSASSNTVFPVEDRASAATSPADVSRTVLNVIGGDKWETAGKSLSYRFRVNESGMYEIVSRFKQDLLDGMYVCRGLYIYSEGLSEGDEGYYNGLPFAEANQIRYNYSDKWQVGAANDGNADLGDFKFYFKEGVTYTLTFEVTLGSMGPVLKEIETILNHINSDYLSIVKLTGSNPDELRDYGFFRVMPEVCIDLIVQSRALADKVTYFENLAGTASSMTATLDEISRLLYKMGSNEDKIATNLSNLKGNIGTLGTLLTDSKNQPLYFDYLLVQGEDAKLPRASSNFLQSFWHELKSFFYSWTRDYNSLGTLAENEGNGDPVEVWLALGRDQAQVIRNLCTNDYTANTGSPVDLKLVAAGTLLPSILSGSGPDVYLGLGSADVINYAIRGALLPIEDEADFAETITDFNESAMLVLGIEDKFNQMHYYGLPEKQTFQMMFVRVDVLANLGLEIPKTWADIYASLPVLEANNMGIGMAPAGLYNIFLYQNDGNLFADNGMRINLDSVKGLSAFETNCNFYTMYSFDLAFDAANRFRTGEMPIVLSDYCALYNQLKVFATEIEGLWTFVPIPGTEDANGNINNCVMSTVTADVVVKGTKSKTDSWKFIQWFCGPEAQASYANEMVAIMGDSAKQATASRKALEMMPWTSEELEQIMLQFNNLAAVPNYPGYYILDRYTNFALMAAYNEKANPVSEILSYINTINKEITRKRTEFELETLGVGQTLAQKRTDQCVEACNLLLKKYKNAQYEEYVENAKYALANKTVHLLQDTASDFEALLAGKEEADYFVYVSHQTMERKFGGYSIDSLDEDQLIFFITTCLQNTAAAYESYN